MSKIRIDPFYHRTSHAITYVVTDLATRQSAIIDPVLDFDMASGTISTCFADNIIDHIDKHGFEIEWILETHAHCDHMSAACYIKTKRGGTTGIGEHITQVQHTVKRLLNLDESFQCNGEQFDQLFTDKELIKLGHLTIHIMHTPGHTPACVSYLIEDVIFVGDTLSTPEWGTVNTDFPNSSTTTLYHSINNILALPNCTRVFIGHDPLGYKRQDNIFETSVIAQKRYNCVVGGKVTLAEFVQRHQQRHIDSDIPHLLLAAIQINIRAGNMPPADRKGNAYLKIPLNQLS
ncbi:MBL fold metallo-hydrolase [Shewanella psychromarinicola]|uniref:MBL fold metallo-hydrolase n=1 Tax=Shewanella psychromarinicola TaxID=2487742 RepID=A0A3N4E7K0_9GAMM|nr:MBL fold metallo-hydrolase [Shewanella psychromarinicola]AZG36319.1 MBL fold metallo-hydrolase [Shewanella psychromarinicola]MCL1080811.1 MBL fold metallo-hydrolase [Shewanella psychromarinicola]RPA34159.1 MBL fold metallo-hydrolase [Shewanella psychromarinicola]